MQNLPNIKEAIIKILDSGAIEITYGKINKQHSRFHNNLNLELENGVLKIIANRRCCILINYIFIEGESIECANTIINFEDLEKYVKKEILEKYIKIYYKKNWWGKKLSSYKGIENEEYLSLELELLDKFWPSVSYTSNMFTFVELKEVNF